ncbi:hypothetical protein P168DRAFT_273148 [Aspergillus campestris IBT 28561]|uniref:Uncharacterized protein n=1 Tax=Aspergillus campestris (strain IBT 28561) TaxID=1392248 RepID=A0A2I1CX26_ASPC2|nr:uncharacterized protein P168DRAFT_273148 [Aspergillus campestris IBT 28561]PKY02171.1 hypothetical protein P168DRAFT_273148 [Aspergillus campestris IBT 28561]
MGAISSTIQSLPPLGDFIRLTPDAYRVALNIFQYFPLFTTLEWLTPYYPAGKSSLPKATLNIPGRLGWMLMELIGPLNLLYILRTQCSNLGIDSLPLPNKLVVALYLIHYVNRAIVSPLMAPSVSPTHVFIVASAVCFNWLNSTCLAGWVLGYEVLWEGFEDLASSGAAVSAGNGNSTAVWVTSLLGTLVFALGMAGNIYSERTLFRLRREEVAKRSSSSSSSTSSSAPTEEKTTSTPKDTTNKESKNKYSKVYVIPPPKGPFTSILYPHYVFEWAEWFGFALAGTAIQPLLIPSLLAGIGSKTAVTAVSPLRLAPWFVPAAKVAGALGVPLPLAGLAFAVNTVANLLPHARWGRKWYVGRFGEEGVKGRGAVVPWCPWL